MAQTESIRVQLEYPLQHVKAPILYHLVRDYHLVPNVRHANIDVHSGGTLVLQLDGEQANLQAGVAFLRGLGIAVTSVGAEQAWIV